MNCDDIDHEHPTFYSINYPGKGRATLEMSHQYKKIAEDIDRYVNQYPDNSIGDESLLRNLFELMIPFKTVIDNCTNVELDYLYVQFPGFYRMASLLEAMAEGIQRGGFGDAKRSLRDNDLFIRTLVN